MKKKLFTLLLALVAIATTAQAQVVLNETNFPDDYLRKYVQDNYDLNHDNYLDESEIASAKEFPKTGTSWRYGTNTGCADFTGIEYFTEIEVFRGYSYRATTLDLSKNTKLKNIQFKGLVLSSINISGCKELEVLSVGDIFRNMPLTELDVSNNTALTELCCYSNQLTALDVSKNTALTVLDCRNNQLTSLDVSKNTALTSLNCNNNQLTSLDVSKNTALTDLDCGYNQLTSLDVSKNTALTSLYCYGNPLSELDVSKNIMLEWLSCGGGSLTSLDVSKNLALTSLGCVNSQLTSLDVSNNTALTRLECTNNRLTSLDVSNNSELTRLQCSSNQLTSLDVSKNTALTYLSCSGNQLTALDVSKNTALTELYCGNNHLTALDVSKNTALTVLSCFNNQLTSLDVSKNTALYLLYCGGNQLPTLDVSKNIALRSLLCAGNKLSSLDFSQNKSLDFVHCYDNQLKGKAMDGLIESLSTVEYGYIMVVDIFNANEANVCTKAQVAAAKEKGWTVTRQIEGYSNDYVSTVYGVEYEGSDPVEEDIDPVDEGDNVDFGSDMDENDDLNGNVIGDIYYNINTGNGGYNAAEGCIVVKKPTDDGTVNNLEGKDIFGEDFKSQFTGIVFKVPAGKGTIKVNAETTGNMMLKVKIGSNDPVEMELNGKLKVTFPYNVSETTYVYIYAGAANEAKGFGTTNDAEDAALKIYGIEFIRDETTAIGTSLNDNGQMTNDRWYTIDGKKLSGEPTKKGIYIYKGKKVKK